MSSYSFLDFNCSMVGVGIASDLGSGAAVAEEGITHAPNEDKNVMQQGADGTTQHSLIASDAGILTIRLLKTSPANAALMAAYNLQKSSSRFWGTNTVVMTNQSTGDVITCQQVAFKRKPDNVNQKEAGVNEWVFDCGKTPEFLGVPL